MTWRRRAVLGTAVCATGAAFAAGGCVVALQRQQRDGRHEDVLRALTFDVAAHRSTGSSAIFNDAFKQLGLRRDRFHAAASHMYPIEKLVERWAAAREKGDATAAGEEVKQLCDRWAAAADAASRIRAKFGRRITHNAQGVDIGTPVEPYFEHAAIDNELRTKVADALDTYGACFLKHALPADVVADIREHLLLQPDTRYKPARELAQRMLDKDPNVSSNRYTLGRLHCLLRGSIFESTLQHVHTPFLPFVYDFFGESLPPREERLAMSEMQLIIAEPMAWEQSWHCDNGHRGLTVLIPLEQIETQGNQLVLPGTHRSLRESLDVLGASKGPITHPDFWEPGDAWVLDSRTMRRGATNSSAHETIPMLIVRYDLTSTMPPGQRVWKAHALVHKGRLLERFFAFYNWF
eukprot:GEMP01053916.1.p1 GENE.GEMP01053916.1~~GEMP01053916.1.p1  ORF type:complete len:423 (+),score=103.86 GEMP01053916.1:49-1269(+)